MILLLEFIVFVFWLYKYKLKFVFVVFDNDIVNFLFFVNFIEYILFLFVEVFNVEFMLFLFKDILGIFLFILVDIVNLVLIRLLFVIFFVKDDSFVVFFINVFFSCVELKDGFVVKINDVIFVICGVVIDVLFL